MRRILISSGLSTGLRADFEAVNHVDIEDKPFAVGGFGEVYHCVSIGGVSPAVKQVVKIFLDNSQGSANHNFQTTQRLQRKLRDRNDLLLQKGKSLIVEYPAFRGVPQFSFKGTINGRDVVGFTSDNLVSQGFLDFENVLQDQAALATYHKFPIEQRMLIASQLVNAFKVLEEFHFIHADLKPGALFVNMQRAEIAIIDYDSGVITENAADEPLTWGAPTDWVAPEIWEQQATVQPGEKIHVDIYSDRWSVAIGIHYLLTTFHPLFYLTEMSPRVARQYFTTTTQWPYINKKAPYFQTANEVFYDQYLPWIENTFPDLIREKLSQTINYGYKQPVARTSYADWTVALISSQIAPKIRVFSSNRSVVIKGVPVELTWEVDNAHTVEISGIGNVSKSGNKALYPDKDILVKLTATGHFGVVDEEILISVFPTPVMETLMVPMPEFSSRVNFKSTFIDLPRNLAEYSFKPQNLHLKNIEIKTPIVSNPIYKIKHSVFLFSALYERIKRRIS